MKDSVVDTWDGSTPPSFTDFDHLRPRLGRDGTPMAYYRAMRDDAQRTGRYIGWSEVHGGFWVAVGYTECEEISRKHEIFSNRIGTFPRYATDETVMLAEQNEPEHKTVRMMVNSPFGPGKVKIYGDQIRENVNFLIDGFIERGEADIAALIGIPVPAILGALLMGLPAEDGPRIAKWVWALTSGFMTHPDQAAADAAEMYDCFEQTIAARKQNPGPDIVSQIIFTEVEGRRFTLKELRGFCTALMLGAFDNTYHLLSSMLWRVGWDIDLRMRLLENPGLAPTVVDESFRCYTPASRVRTVEQDVTYQGIDMKAGQHIMLIDPIANRDPRMFQNPDNFIPDRTPNKHLALGWGIHRCLGQHLIALESRIVLEEFLKRIPDYSLDAAKPSRWKTAQVSGMTSVPIVFPRGKRQSKTTNAGVETWLKRAAE